MAKATKEKRCYKMQHKNTEVSDTNHR